MILIMTVEPGFGGQKIIPETIEKVRMTRKILSEKKLDHVDIQVDGGITIDNVDEVLDAGANVIVAGSAVFKGSPSDNTKKFLKKLFG